MRLKKVLSVVLACTISFSTNIVFANSKNLNIELQDDDIVTEEPSVGTEIGDSVDNPIEINSALDLFNIRNIENWATKYYKLTSDIDLNELSNLEDEQKIGELSKLMDDETWISPEGVFYGDFDGNGHIIKNLNQKCFYIEDRTGYAGLFSMMGTNGVNSASVHDLNFESVNIFPDQDRSEIKNYCSSGAICGVLLAGDVFNCNVKSAAIAGS